MRRKFLSVVLCVCMMLTMAPFAFAAGETESETPTPPSNNSGSGSGSGAVTAGITTEKALKDAISAASENETITLGGSITLTAPIIIKKKISLDMDGHTFSSTQDIWNDATSAWSFISVQANGDLTITGNGTFQTKANDCYAVDVQDGATLTIENGTFVGNVHAIYVFEGSLFVHGGTYSIQQKYTNAAQADEFVLNCYDANRRNGSATISVSGGSFINFNPANCQAEGIATNFCADGYTTTSTTIGENTIYTVGAGTNSAVANAGANYNTLQSAINSVEANSSSTQTVTLLKDVTEDIAIPSDKTLTLDLNGKKLPNVSSDTITVASGANLTITGEGTVDNVTHGKADIYNNGTVILNNGNYTRSQEAKNTTETSGGNSYYNILNHGNMTIDGAVKVLSTGHFSSLVANGYYNYGSTNPRDGYVNGTNQASPKLTINNGSFSGGINTIKNDDNATLEIKAGTFTNYTQSAFQNHHIATIEGGTFDGANVWAVLNCGAANCPVSDTDKHETTITGGFFNGNFEKTAGSITISGGYFTTDPSDYLSTNPQAYTVASNKDGYSYMVTTTEPTKAPVIVKDATDTALAPSITDENTKTEIQKVINKANVDGTAESIKDSGKSAIINAAVVAPDEQNNKNNKITIDVKVTVTATAANLTDNSATSSITFSAAPVATVTVNSGTPSTGIPVSNDYLNGKEITVKLPLPENFTPKQIKHISSDNSVEYFLDHPERGAKTFDVEDGCAVFTINKFSTFVVSGTQDYVAPSSGSSSGSTSYAVNVNAATNGAVAADKKTASKGTTVTVRASPSKGYVVDAVKVVDKDGKDVAVTGKDGKYVFTMPASAVTVTGSFKAETPAPVALPFTDVKSGNWFYDAVKYAYAQGLMTGTSATTFAPNGTMNRAMIVTVLYRLEKSPAVTGASKFTDVPAGQWYSDAVAWAAANKIVNGYDETTFGPMNAVTREQMAAILFRYEQVKGLENVTLEENLNRFPDQNKISAYAIPALQWAVGQKIINGNADGTLDPTGTATRAQVAQIFTNLLNK